VLDALVAGAVDDAVERQRILPLSQVEAAAIAASPAIDALAALAPRDTIRVIAEIKRASPSKGPLAEITDPAALAAAYESGGASAISVLTEQRRFLGSLDDLTAVKAAVGIPVLRKDFIATEYQVLEARAAGADLVLLIVAALDDPTLARLHTLIRSLGMTALVEVHSADEADRAAALGAQLIGVNARDLSTFELDTTLFGRLVGRLPTGTIAVAESAVQSPDDVARYRADGADVVLVGEALVKNGDPSAGVRSFIEATSPAA
jgi:indole-3-glycerol phosphate synthase